MQEYRKFVQLPSTSVYFYSPEEESGSVAAVKIVDGAKVNCRTRYFRSDRRFQTDDTKCS